MLKEDARRRNLREASNLLERAWASLPSQFLETPHSAHPALAFDELPTYLRDWLEHDQPGVYWSAHDVSQSLAKINIPTLHVSGWYDTYLRGSVDGFNAMRAHAEHQYLLAGPWIHIPWGDRIGPLALGSEANLDTDAVLLRWFNHWLKGTNEFATEPAIRHFALNENKWHDASEFAAPTLLLYLRSQGRANSSKGDGLLRRRPPQGDEPPDLFVHDPEVPVASPGIGPVNQAALELGNNVLVYTSKPFLAAAHLFGSVEVNLYAASSAPCTDFMVKLICLKPNGDAMFVAIGAARSSFLLEAYAADEPRLWRIAIEPTSCVFAAGDCLRIEIASSAYPLFDRNPGTAVAPRLADSWTWRRSTQTVYHDAKRASVIYLPIVGGLK
jgi:putative CocE/NonD family hydrolase